MFLAVLPQKYIFPSMGKFVFQLGEVWLGFRAVMNLVQETWERFWYMTDVVQLL